MPTSRFLREVALGRKPEVSADGASREVLCQLGRIGNNLNQLGRIAEEQGEEELCRELQLAMTELRAAIRRVAL